MTCAHRWLLGAPSQGKVQGRCKLCGAERTFSPSFKGWNRNAKPVAKEYAEQERLLREAL